MRHLIRTDYKKYLDNIESQLKSNIKCFWSYTANKRNNKTVPRSITWDNSVFNNDREVAEGFSRYFASTFEPSNTPTLISSKTNLFDPIIVSSICQHKIKNFIDRLDINKGAGPDGLPAFFIKKCSDSLLLPLSIIYNQSLQLGLFPDIWKCAQITPVHKGGNKSDIKNYRPISILSLPGKILEAIVTDELFFAVKNRININQHGFFHGRSTYTNLITFVQNISEALDDRYAVDAVYTDFAKAFKKFTRPCDLLNCMMLVCTVAYLSGLNHF